MENVNLSSKLQNQSARRFRRTREEISNTVKSEPKAEYFPHRTKIDFKLPEILPKVLNYIFKNQKSIAETPAKMDALLSSSFKSLIEMVLDDELKGAEYGMTSADRSSLKLLNLSFIELLVGGLHSHASDDLKKLLSLSTNVSFPDSENNTLLHIAVGGNRIETAKVLLSLGADVNAKNDEGIFPLVMAVLFKHRSMISLLHKYKANFEEKDKDGKTTFHILAARGMFEMLDEIQKYRVNIHTRDINQHTALHCSVHNFNYLMTKKLIELGLDVDAQDVDGHSPLHHAAVKDIPKIAKLLIEYKANLNIKSFVTGRSPLMCAIVAGKVQVAQLLIECGADIFLADHKGYFPIHYAAVNQQKNIMKALLKAGCPHDLVNADGRTAFELLRFHSKWKSRSELEKISDNDIPVETKPGAMSMETIEDDFDELDFLERENKEWEKEKSSI